MRNNYSSLEYSRTCQAAASGMAAGILRLTGMPGFIFYFVTVAIQALFWEANACQLFEVVHISIQVTELTEHLRKSENSFDSDATDCIYRAIKIMARQTQNNSLGSLCSSPVRSPVPGKIVIT
ncbi:unnamed protein product [Cylicocyclus nassatus]|uniref:ER membrane protein complex subunit 6 n=1 Tax=Cylicocyclus nassatus TaxID=53992 RepID=A0AA36GEK0_CYLNA|nr:unnamed protein product [Cylicocyclus nassatus]